MKPLLRLALLLAAIPSVTRLAAAESPCCAALHQRAIRHCLLRGLDLTNWKCVDTPTGCSGSGECV